MQKILTEEGRERRKFPALGGYLFESPAKQWSEITVLLGGFARVATEEKCLLAIADRLNMPVAILDWHGLGFSRGDFANVTVENLYLDLRRFVGYLMSKGYFKFNLIGHSLGACVIATAYKRQEFDIGKISLLSPALNQQYLLRYWFARSLKHDLGINQWRDYNDTEYCIRMSIRYRQDMSKNLWPHEYQFQIFCGQHREVKGVFIRSDYWMTEKDYNYCSLLPNMRFPGILGGIIRDKNILCITGESDTAVPLDCVKHNFPDCSVIRSADHYYKGYEMELSNIVAEFFCKI